MPTLFEHFPGAQKLAMLRTFESEQGSSRSAGHFLPFKWLDTLPVNAGC